MVIGKSGFGQIITNLIESSGEVDMTLATEGSWRIKPKVAVAEGMIATGSSFGRSGSMRMAMYLLLAVVVVSFHATVEAASLDCEKANSAVEKMICADAELSRLDDDLAKAYSKKMSLQNTRQGVLTVSQKAWLEKRNKCGDSPCIQEVYKQRLDELAGIERTVTSVPGIRGNTTEHSLETREPRYYTFDLTKGNGIPVCEAYLQRLNNTDFQNMPYCGRPEDDSVPGFTRLNRVPLYAERIYRLLPKILGFQSSQNQGYWKNS